MVHAAILTFAALAGGPADLPIPESEWKTYQAAKAEAQRNPEAHIKLALWCEQHGLDAERLKHLAIATLVDPKNATARGLLGLVDFKGQWKKPEAIAEKVQADPELAAALAEYQDRRGKINNTAVDHWNLAVWCEKKGLKAEAMAHLATVVRLNPAREQAWKRLGCKKVGNRWLTESQLQAAKAHSEAQQKASQHSKPLFEKWRTALASKDESRRAEAQKQLAGVTDPYAAPLICVFFGSGSGAEQSLAVQMLGQIDSAPASRALAVLAVFGKTDDVRRRATETLRRRDAREFADLLIGLLHEKIDYELKPVAGPNAPGELLVKGKKYDLKRLYAVPVHPFFPYVILAPGDQIGLDAQGQPVIMRHTTLEIFAGTVGNGEPSPVVNPAYFTYGNTTTNPTFTGNWPAPVRALPLGFSLPASGFGLLPLTSGVWQQLPAGFGSYDYGMTSYSPMNYVVVGTTGTRSSIAAALSGTPYPGGRPVPIVNGQGGLLNNYFAFRQDGLISVSKMFEEAGQPDTAAAQRRLNADVKLIDLYNDSAETANRRTAAILTDVTGQDLGTEREAWKKWWIDQVGYAYFAQKYDDKPTVVQDVPINSQPSGVRLQSTPLGYYQRISCFGAGTMVRTLTGSRAIETLNVGDEVLSQDTKTGALSYQPILVVHHNPPSKTFLIQLGEETIVSSPFHRFWNAGKGWVMARDLEEGDVIRTLAGLQKVSSKQDGPVQPVFNLDVAETASFFVGRDGALVHDNTLPSPELQPFDAEPVLTAIKTAAP